MKKPIKIAVIVLLIALVAGLLWFGNIMMGNPVSILWHRKLQKHFCQTDSLAQIIRWSVLHTVLRMVGIMRL